MMTRGMEEKDRLNKLGKRRKTDFIFLNEILEMMGIDSSEVCTLKGRDTVIRNCSKKNFRWTHRKKQVLNYVAQTETSVQRCCETSVSGDFKNLTG